MSKTCIAEYSIANQDTVYFHAKFSAPRIQLICEEGSSKAILYLTIEDGHWTPIDRGRAAKSGYVSLPARRYSNDGC